jgi:hypothetical protein
LSGVFGLVCVIEHASAESKHHCPVPFDERSERNCGERLRPSDESREELAVRELG